jgi:hypothetical protein
MNIVIDDKKAISVIAIEIQAGKTEYKFGDQYLFKDKNVFGIYASNEYINDADIASLHQKARLKLLIDQKTVIDDMKLSDLRLYPTYFELRLGKILFEKSSLRLESNPTASEVGKKINIIVVYER